MTSAQQQTATLFLLLCTSLRIYIEAFSAYHDLQPKISSKRSCPPTLFRTNAVRIRHEKKITVMNILWFGKDKEKEKRDADMARFELDRQQLGGTDMGETVTMMENFKKAQNIGKKTSALLQELSSTTIEGVAADGKVRIFVDGQQRPKGADIDEKYLASVTAEDLNTAITAAMQDANIKSTEQMEEKMQALYTEVGLPPPEKS